MIQSRVSPDIFVSATIFSPRNADGTQNQIKLHRYKEYVEQGGFCMEHRKERQLK
jgi:hypothetical protein